MHHLMMFQLCLCIETLWTFSACIWPYTFMLKYMTPKLRTSTVFLLTDVTCQPSTFIVRLQQMCLELVRLCKTLWTVSTWVRLCTSVITNMLLQFTVCLKQLPTIRTFIWSSLAVCLTFVCVHVAGLSETFITQWTLVWFISRVDSHVCLQSSRLTKHFLTHVTFVRFLTTVNSTVLNKAMWCC